MMSTHTVYRYAEREPRTKVNIAFWFTAIALTLSGLALIIAKLVLSEHIPDEYAAALVAIQVNMQAYMLAQWMTLAFTIIMPLGLIGVAALAYQRRAWLAYIGASLAVVGNLFHPAVFTYEGMLLPTMARLTDQQPAMVALLDRFNNNPTGLPLFILMFVFNLGLLVMAIGLWRKGLEPAWVAGMGVAGVLLHFFAPEGLFITQIIALVLLTAFLTATGFFLVKHMRSDTAAT
jgi:hypothetical protein